MNNTWRATRLEGCSRFTADRRRPIEPLCPSAPRQSPDCSLAIRAGQPVDHGTILRVWRDASRSGHLFLSDADLDGQEAIIAREHLHTADIWLAERSGRVLGFIAHVETYIGALFVSPSAQGAGVGRRLIDHLKGRHAWLRLGVYEANVRARRFYEREGFVVGGRADRDEEGRPFPVLQMEWRR